MGIRGKNESKKQQEENKRQPPKLPGLSKNNISPLGNKNKGKILATPLRQESDAEDDDEEEDEEDNHVGMRGMFNVGNSEEEKSSNGYQNQNSNQS